MSAGMVYRSFLLRLWRTADGSWRAALEDPHTGEQRAFASLEQLSAHLAGAARSDFASVERELPAPAAPPSIEPQG